jgi:hypothetical protein
MVGFDLTTHKPETLPLDHATPEQGCHMVYFQTKKSKFGQFLEGLAMEDVGIFMDNWYILQRFVIFY